MVGGTLAFPVAGFPTPSVEGGAAFINQTMKWTGQGVDHASGIPPATEFRNINTTAPFIGAGLTQQFQFGGLPVFLSVKADLILPSGNKNVAFGNNIASQTFLVKQSDIYEVKASATVPITPWFFERNTFGQWVQRP